MFAYVGSRTTRERNARGEGITVFSIDSASGALSHVQLLGELLNPSFLALSRGGEFLYSVHGDHSDVSSFRVSPETGMLSYINTQSTAGLNPAHLAINPSGKFLIVSNHYGGSLAVLPINDDGALGTLCDLIVMNGPIGPHRVEQNHAKPHFNPFTPDGRFVIVPDKGLDRIFSFNFDGERGRLSPAPSPFVETREGAGPRHIAFHPTRSIAYAVNELDSTVTTYRYDLITGDLSATQVLSSLPESFTGNSRAAEIEVDRLGRFVYASNRGYDSIAIFRIDPQTGLLAFLHAEPSRGRTPRFFALSPNGRHLYAANEDSDNIVTFSIDPESGALTATGSVTPIGSPVCMVFGATQLGESGSPVI